MAGNKDLDEKLNKLSPGHKKSNINSKMLNLVILVSSVEHVQKRFEKMTSALFTTRRNAASKMQEKCVVVSILQYRDFIAQAA